MNYKQKKRYNGYDSLAASGFSLAEAMLAMVILAAAASSILLPFASGAAVRAEGTHRTLAAKLASDLMEEIIATDFDYIINDYGVYIEPEGDVNDVSGTKFVELDAGSIYVNFSRSATCEIFEESLSLIIATVTVKYNEDELVSLSRLISQ